MAKTEHLIILLIYDGHSLHYIKASKSGPYLSFNNFQREMTSSGTESWCIKVYLSHKFKNLKSFNNMTLCQNSFSWLCQSFIKEPSPPGIFIDMVVKHYGVDPIQKLSYTPPRCTTFGTYLQSHGLTVFWETVRK